MGVNTEVALHNFMDNVMEGINKGKSVSGLFLDTALGYVEISRNEIRNQMSANLKLMVICQKKIGLQCWENYIN